MTRHPTGTCISGFIDAALIQREIPDFKERMFYISGPRAMVLRFQRALKELGVARSRVKVDFFPGFAPWSPAEQAIQGRSVCTSQAC